MVTTRQTKKGARPERRDDAPQPPALQPAPGRVEVNVAILPTLDGVKSLLNAVSVRLPDQAPPAPPRKGTAWQDGYMTGIADAREVIASVRDGLRFRHGVEIAPQPTTHREAPDMATTDQADTRTTDYPWVGAWERMMMASDPDHIEELVALARSEGAPQTATYRRGRGDWSTIDDIVSLDTQRRLGLPTTPEAAVMTTHRKASEALHTVTGVLADLRSVEVPASLAIERSDVMHDLDRAARFLAHAQLRTTELAAKIRAEVR